MSVADLLRRMSLFADLHEDELAALADCLSRRIFAEPMILFHKSSPADSLYVIESGAVRIFACSESGQELTLNVYGPGECFGETALLDGNLRTTGTVTLEKTVTYALNRGNFLRRLELRSQGARHVMALLVHRLERVTAYTENWPSWIWRAGWPLCSWSSRSAMRCRTGAARATHTQAKVPTEVRFQTKPEQAMLEQARQAWCTHALGSSDEVYGDATELWDLVARNSRWYVLAVRTPTPVWIQRPALLEPEALARGRPRTLLRLPRGAAATTTAKDVVASWPERRWQRLVVAEGGKGRISYDWARQRVVESRNGWPGRRLADCQPFYQRPDRDCLLPVHCAGRHLA